jgi:hypothetical protein
VLQAYSVYRVPQKGSGQSLTVTLQLEYQSVRSPLLAPVQVFQAGKSMPHGTERRVKEKFSTLSVVGFSNLLRSSVRSFVRVADRFDCSEHLAEFDLGFEFQWQSAVVVTDPDKQGPATSKQSSKD